MLSDKEARYRLKVIYIGLLFGSSFLMKVPDPPPAVPPLTVPNIEQNKIRQENNLENEQDSGKIVVQTGGGKILKVKNSSISYQDDELEEIILAKDSNSSFFADGFTPPLPQKQRGQTTTGLGGSNPGNGSGGSSGSGNGSGSGSQGSSSSNSLIKYNHPYIPQSAPKTQKQKALEKKKKELRESVEAEEHVNAHLKKNKKKIRVTVMIKDGARFFAPHSKLRAKFHHVRDVEGPIPEALDNGELERLADPNLYEERMKTFNDREILPNYCVVLYGKRIREHVLDPDTKKIAGTLGANAEAKTGEPKIHGYHLYNDKTGLDVFFDDKNTYKTGFILNAGQEDDLINNQNIM